ncbi:MAG TPA: RNA methyltransferase [Anaerolineae bacterium]|nr:RNA methyltransferase [Anaerolineae bacterium]
MVEGVRLIEEMIQAGREPAFFFYTGDGSESTRAGALVEALTSSRAEVLAVSEDVMRFMADTKTPQGVLAVAGFPEVAYTAPSFSLVLDGVRDPGNLGTILRTSEAAGVEQVVTLRGTVDVFSPKVVRGAMGAHFCLHMLWDGSWEEVERSLEGKQALLSDPRAGTPYYQVDWTVPTVLMVGGEAHGAGRKARGLATQRVAIPMKGRVESLNVAVATGVMLFEAARQRTEASGTAEEGD